MNTFGSNLKELLIKKNLKRADFAKSIYIQRSTLYKYIDGTTLPDEKLLENMKKILNLSKDELEIFDQAYLECKFGKGILKNRETIHKILEDINCFYNDSLIDNKHKKKLLSSTSYLPEDLKIFLENLLTVDNIQYEKIRLNTTQSEAVSELLKFIINILNENSKDITIDHIFHYKSIENVHDSVDNMEFLSNISTLISSYEKYNPFFYSVTTSHNTYNIFPNIIIINKTIIYISNDFKIWHHIDEKNNSNINNLITCFYKEFSKAKNQTNPLIKIIRDMPSFLEFITDIENNTLVEYGFRRDLTCFSPPPVMTSDWFEFDPNLISLDYLNLIIDLHNGRLKNFVDRLNSGFKYFCISAYNSSNSFLNKGRIYDQGEYPTFKIEARIKIIMNLLYYLCKYKDFDIYLLKDDSSNKFSFIDKIQLCTNDSTLMISICDENLEICKRQPFAIALSLDSLPLVNCFNDYIVSLTRNLTYSKEESVLLIKEQLDAFALENDISLDYDEIILNYINKIRNTALTS